MPGHCIGMWLDTCVRVPLIWKAQTKEKKRKKRSLKITSCFHLHPFRWDRIQSSKKRTQSNAVNQLYTSLWAESCTFSSNGQQVWRQGLWQSHGTRDPIAREAVAKLSAGKGYALPLSFEMWTIRPAVRPLSTVMLQLEFLKKSYQCHSLHTQCYIQNCFRQGLSCFCGLPECELGP